MKRLLSVMFVVALLMININITIPALAAVDNSKYIPKIIRTDEGTKMIFDPELAETARKMSVDAYGIKSGTNARDIANTFRNEDFDDDDIKQSTTKWYDLTTSSYSNNFLVGVKTFEIDGKKKHVMAIAFRGTKDFVDIVTDAVVWDDQGYHSGFRASASEAYDTLSGMKFDSIKNEKGKSIKFTEFLELSKYTDDYFLLVTGHSLGGAIANVFTVEFLGHTKTTCYTFGCPEVCSPSVSSTVNAYNIFNIVNTLDSVPTVGFEICNGARFGTDLIGSAKSSDGILPNHSIKTAYKEVTKQVINNINSQYKYTIPYYIKWKNGGTDDTTGSNGGGFRGENNTQEPVTPQGTTTNNSEQIERNKIIQARLNHIMGAGLVVDGICGQKTIEAIKNFQRAYGLAVDGICGSMTWNKLEEVYNNPQPTPTPSIPAAISFSKSQLKLDYNSHPSETITITASGDLPKSYHLYYKFDSALSVTSGQWNGSNISMTIEMKGGPVKNNKIEVYLMDSSDNVYATNTIYVNATVPTIKQNTEIVLSKDNISIHFPDKQYEKMLVTIEGPILDNSTISIDTNESVTFEWGGWSNNRAELTIQSSRTIPANYTPCGYATIYIKDGNGNIYASKQFNLTSTVAKYAVRYDANGGYDAPDTHYIYHNHWGERVSSHIPKREGYKFEGWSTSKNGKVEYGPSQQLVKDHDIVFYAVWEKIEDLFSLELARHSKHDGSFEAAEYYIDGDRFWIDDILFHCDKNIECNWSMVENEDGRHSIILQIDRNGDISSSKLSFDVVDEDGYILFSDTLSVFENYNKKQQFSDRNQTGISVYVNGKKLKFDVQPQIINNRTMVPMRKIFEELGTIVGWNNNTQNVIAVRKGDIIRIGIGGLYMTCNDERKMLDSPAVIISGRTLVPVRAIAESLNCDVEWYDYGTSQVVDINMNHTVESMENKGGLLIGWSEYAPFSYVDENGNLTGFDTDLAKYVCNFWGWDASFVEIPFDMSLTSVMRGEIDCYWSGVTKTEERAEMCTFTNHYIEFDIDYDDGVEKYTSHEVYSVPFRKDDYDTVELVNIALDEAKKDGTIEHLKWKYGIR